MSIGRFGLSKQCHCCTIADLLPELEATNDCYSK